jgi:hypothetical protein
LARDSFFSRIQSWFSGSFHGRYLAYILAEIGKHHPQIIRELICTSCNLGTRSLPNPVFEPEYAFQGSVGLRRADMAVFANPDDEEPIVLVEIKYRDKLIPADGIRPAQLSDYEHWCAAEKGRYCLVLSRESLSPNGVCTVTWTQAARVLRRRANDSDLAKALIEHLEEEGIVMQNIEPKALIGFFKRLLCAPNGAGIQAGNLEGPQEFARLLRNVKLLSARFNADFKAAWKQAGDEHNKADDPAGTKDATINFTVSPRVDSAFNASKLVDAKDGSINSKALNGGLVFVWARHSLGSGKGWLRVGYGFWFEIDKSVNHEKANLPKAHLYAWAESHEFSGEKEIFSEKKLSSFALISSKAEDSVDKLDGLTSEHLYAVLTELKKTGKELSSKQRRAVGLLIKSVGAKRPAAVRQ